MSKALSVFRHGILASTAIAQFEAGGGPGPGVFEDAFTNSFNTTDQGTWTNYTLRFTINKDAFLRYGATCRVGFKAPTGATLSIQDAYIGLRAAAGDIYDFQSTPTELLFSGVSGFSGLAAETIIWSDDTAFAIDGSTDIVISYRITSDSMPRGTIANNFSVLASRYKNANDAATVNASGYTAESFVGGLAGVQVKDVYDVPDDLAHEYWRILPLGNNGDGANVTVAKLEMYEDYSRVNQCFGGTPLGTGVFTNDPVDAFGQDYTQQFVGAFTAPWVGYQFATPVNIHGVMLRARDIELDMPPDRFAVQYSDDGTLWTTKWVVTGQTSWLYREGRWFWEPTWAAGQSYSGSPLPAYRYLRVYGMDNEASGGSGGVSCAELEFRSTPGGTDETDASIGVGTSFATGFTLGFEPEDAFDNNASTRWASSSSSDLNFIGWDFGASDDCVVAEIAWTAANNNLATAIQSIRRGIVQGSDDNTNWHSFYDCYNATQWTVGGTRTFTDPLYV